MFIQPIVNLVKFLINHIYHVTALIDNALETLVYCITYLCFLFVKVCVRISVKTLKQPLIVLISYGKISLD